MKNNNALCFLLFYFLPLITNSQLVPANVVCPPNIGFEAGTFYNWNCFIGHILRDGSLNLSTSSPVSNRHTIIPNSYPQELDPYGKFPVNCPNGSGYSVRLGNSGTNGQAERISYTFIIPSNQNDYSILYNYAVVFQNPPHQPWEQPRFTSKVYNVTDDKYIDCGSFEFVASSFLPGFQLSITGNNVFFKPWSPVTVNLKGLAGKTVRLEFTTNDCAFTQHFGYAYLDVNEDCSSSPISGNTYCGGAKSITLTAPFGFAGYNWYTSDFSQLLGNENILSIKPPPPANTTYALEIIPYEGIGCQDTLFTTIHFSPEPFKLNVIDEIKGCPSGVDLTAPAITAGSTPGLSYSYYSDLNQMNYVPVPSKVNTSGIYYIKAINNAGCNEIKPIKVTVLEPPDMVIKNPAGACKPQTIDLTDASITLGSEPGLVFTYWKNSTTTIPIPNPKAIDVSGTYYIMGTKNSGCGAVKPVEVKIGDVPNIVINNPSRCGSVNLTDAAVTAGSTPGISYTYWTDAAASISLEDPNAITVNNTYYIMASSPSGCSVIRPLVATINPYYDFVVTDPPTAVYPVMTIDLTSTVNQNAPLTFTYWLDSLTRKPVKDAKAVDKRARYYIRGTNEFGCSIVKPVNAVIIPPTEPIVYAPTAFTPNNDGLNDVFKIKIIGETAVSHLRIFNRWGQMVYDEPNLNKQWNGKLKGIELPAGVYVWVLDGIDTYYKNPFSQKGLITLIR